jgi:hypothetical protein
VRRQGSPPRYFLFEAPIISQGSEERRQCMEHIDVLRVESNCLAQRSLKTEDSIAGDASAKIHYQRRSSAEFTIDCAVDINARQGPIDSSSLPVPPLIRAATFASPVQVPTCLEQQCNDKHVCVFVSLSIHHSPDSLV